MGNQGKNGYIELESVKPGSYYLLVICKKVEKCTRGLSFEVFQTRPGIILVKQFFNYVNHLIYCKNHEHVPKQNRIGGFSLDH